MPASAKGPDTLSVLWRMKPNAYGPTNPPRLTNVVMSAIPEAAEGPVRNSLGNAQRGPR